MCGCKSPVKEAVSEEYHFIPSVQETLPPQDAECGTAMRARAAQGHEGGS